MKVLGISGLENSMPFKKKMWPGLEEREYRIAQGMDAAAALVIDGKLAAAAEQERFSGKKATGSFPIDAIRFCLKEAGIKISEIDEIAHGFNYAPYRDLYLKDEVSAKLYNTVFSREALLAQVRRDLPGFPEEKVFSVGHHMAHAASAAYTSGWDECLVVVNDAMGEIEKLPGVKEAALFGKGLHVVCDDSRDAATAIGRLLAEQGTRVHRMERIVPSLEDVFVSLIEAHDRAEQPQEEVAR